MLGNRNDKILAKIIDDAGKDFAAYLENCDADFRKRCKKRWQKYDDTTKEKMKRLERFLIKNKDKYEMLK